MNDIAALDVAVDPDRFGSKAVALGAAARAGLPVPPGFALSHIAVADIGAGDRAASGRLAATLSDASAGAWEAASGDGEPVGAQWAVRSSAVGEDSPLASFAGIHQSILGVTGAAAVVEAVRAVHDSARGEGPAAYRRRLGLAQAVRMAVIVQKLVDADAAGVMFTRNPVTGAAERVIEASWGLGEAVVSGLVTPDRYVLDEAGRLTEWHPGEKDLAIRLAPTGGTCEVPLIDGLVTAPCLTEADLAGLHRLALQCDAAFGATDHDVEFAVCGGTLYLLQRRPITRA